MFLQVISEETRNMKKLSATLRRVCCPKPTSGKLEVSRDIYKQWRAGGTQRDALLETLIKCGGDKDGHLHLF